MDELRDLYINISGILKAMSNYWDYDMPDLRDCFNEIPDSLTEFKDALDDAWDKFIDLMDLVEAEAEENE